jgi:hypothetical protein
MMSTPGTQFDRRGCLRLILILGAIFVFLFLFRTELKVFWILLKYLPDLIARKPVDIPWPVKNFELPGFLIFFGFNVLGVLLLIAVMVYLIAGTVLPVRTGTEHWQAMERFASFVLGNRHAFIRIREGAVVQGQGPPKRYLGGGIALVDLNSAIVLERRGARGRAIVEGSSRAKGAYSSGRPVARVGKPGLVFIRWGERLRGVVSLRTQFRINLGVLEMDAEGVEVKTHVFSMFTLGKQASVLKVAYFGNPEEQNLRVLDIDPGTKQIRAIADELDDIDKAEIHDFARRFMQFGTPSGPLEPVERSKLYPPYPIDDQRIFSAVYARARQVGDDKKIENWTDLPALVATELFRSMFSQVKLDDLYLPEDPRKFPLLATFKPTFARTMRHMGVLSYQFIYRLDGQPPAEGQRVDNRSFRISAVQDLTSSKPLRDCGIKVIHAGFTELNPTDIAVKQQRVDSWRAHWQQEADAAIADRERAVMKIRSRARAKAQGQMIKKLSKVLGNSSFSEEAMTLQVLQVIEEAASDPDTRKFLPTTTLDMMRRLRRSLVPADTGFRAERLQPEVLDEKLRDRRDKQQELPDVEQDEMDGDERQPG